MQPSQPLRAPLDGKTSPCTMHQPHPGQPQQQALQTLACSASSAALVTLMSCPASACGFRARTTAEPNSQPQLSHQNISSTGHVPPARGGGTGPDKLRSHPPLVYLYPSWAMDMSGFGRTIWDLESDLLPHLCRD